MRHFSNILILILLLTACSTIDRPGPRKDGSILLPNNWSLTPAGEQVNVGDLPLAMALDPSGAYLMVTNNGYADQYVSVIDVVRRAEVGKIPMKESWLGLAFNAAGSRIYVSGGGSDAIAIHEFTDGRTSPIATRAIKPDNDKRPYFVSGIAVSADEHRLYACALRQSKLAVFDLDDPASPPSYVDVGAYPYTVVLSEPRQRAYVSNWGGKSISVINLAENTEIDRVEVGDHPNAMVIAESAGRLFVTSANTNELTVIDITDDRIVQVLDLSPYPDAPASGTTPNGLALSPDQLTLYVANADNNSVSVIDLKNGQARIAGAIPTGWYPTAVVATDDVLLIANGKGLGSKPNPHGPQPINPGRTPEYIGELFLGTVSILSLPSVDELQVFSRQVIANNGFDTVIDKLKSGSGNVPARAIPRHLGDPSLIKHVFYILKENRSYDQVFGDMREGEGDPALALFGKPVTPNHHALAQQFVLFDNFYVDAEVSQDGHSWSMGAYATDFNEKLWPTNYSNRTFPAPIYIDVAYPTAGFLWDAAAAANLTYRSYGEFTRKGEDGKSVSALPALKEHTSPDYPTLDLTIRDSVRADVFIRELGEMIATDSVPALNILSLPSDHTMGTRPGAPTPRAMMADNDLALGRIVEAISNSAIWKDSVVFVIQDDSQNGPDHIDAHRTVALIASPYAKRGFVDHTMYDTVSLLRTLELILGIPPMSQYDAAAVPMFDAFTNTPDLRPFVAKASTWPLDEQNTELSYGAELSAKMNFAEMDAAPERLLNEIIWKSVYGAESVMPTPHSNRTFVDLDDDDGGNNDQDETD